MLVTERMTINPVTITAAATVRQALEVMERFNLRALPVVDDRGGLEGILSERDLLRAEPTASVQRIMTRDVVTIGEYAALEEAARVMVDHKVSSLPVMRQGKLVGMITETDLFETFMELLGAREKGLRLTMLVPEEKGMLASMTSEIARMDGNILSLSTCTGEDPTNRLVTVKVAGVPREKLVAVMEALGMEIVDARGEEA